MQCSVALTRSSYRVAEVVITVQWYQLPTQGGWLAADALNKRGQLSTAKHVALRLLLCSTTYGILENELKVTRLALVVPYVVLKVVPIKVLMLWQQEEEARVYEIDIFPFNGHSNAFLATAQNCADSKLSILHNRTRSTVFLDISERRKKMRFFHLVTLKVDLNKK